MRRVVPVAFVLLLGLASCSTPVSQLKLPQEQRSQPGAGEQESTVSVVETDQEAASGPDSLWFPPMASFGHTILGGNGLLNAENEQGSEFMVANGKHSVASSLNTYRISDAGDAQAETQVFRVQFGTENLVRFACQGAGVVRLQAKVGEKVIAEDSLRCAIPANELGMEFAVPESTEVTITQQPSPETRGFYELAFYD